MKILVNEAQLINLSENVQLADKRYFNTGKLNSEDKQFILSVTRGDQTTKLISDIYFIYKDQWGFKNVKDNLPKIHRDLIEYNKNVYPIKDFDLYNPSGVNYYHALMSRHEIIDGMKILPSVAIRNLRNDIRTPRTPDELYTYKNELSNFLANISMLNNRDENTRKKILQKLYKSNMTLDDLSNFVEDKENLIGGVEFTREKIEEIINDSYGEVRLIHDENNVMVLQVESADGIKQIGCNSLWCFTYGENNYQTWNNYSTYGMVYVIVNLNESSDSPEFMWVLIKPIDWNSYDDNGEYDYDNNDSSLFNMSNDNYYDPLSVLTQLIGNKKLIKQVFTFDMEDEDDEYREICDEFEDQLSDIKDKFFNGKDRLENEFTILTINNGGEINCKEGTINISYYNKKTGEKHTGNIKIDKLPTYATNLQLFEHKIK